MENKNTNHTIAITVGFILILLIAAITIIRPYFAQKKSTTIATTPSQDDTQTKNPKQLSSEQLLTKMSSQENLILLDIRSKDAFAQEHLVGSINVPLDTLEPRIATFKKSNTYVIIDDGSRNGSSIALDFFPQNGLANTFYLDGGFPGWRADNNSTVSIGDPSSIVDQSKVTYLNSQDLKKLLENESNLFIIDLRSDENYKNGHIKNALNIPLAELENRHKEIPLGKKTILYDKDGLWAFQGGVRLFDLGVFNVSILSDGLDTWKQKNFALEK